MLKSFFPLSFFNLLLQIRKVNQLQKSQATYRHARARGAGTAALTFLLMYDYAGGI